MMKEKFLSCVPTKIVDLQQATITPSNVPQHRLNIQTCGACKHALEIKMRIN